MLKRVTKGPGARATLGHLSVWFGEYQIVTGGSNSENKLPIYSRSYVLSSTQIGQNE